MDTARIHGDLAGKHYMRQLDGLRAVAVLGVMIEHWVPDAYRFHLPWGTAGVHLFFVLSGFLITGILLGAREDASKVNQPVWSTLFRFYARRFLRIFPLYYAVVILAALTLAEGRENLLPNLLYLSNFTQWHEQAWAGAVAHFWSLAVEEQFYLVWPFLMLLAPVLLVRPVVWATVLIAPLFRVAMALFRPEDRFFEILPLSCLDALALGAVLSILQRHGSSRCFENACFIVGLPLWIVTRALVISKAGLTPITTLETTALSLIFAAVIGRASRGFPGITGRVLTFGPIVYLGTISYGLYVMHNLVFPIVLSQIDLYPLPAIRNHWLLRFPLLLCTTILFASLSWFAFERPINQLKRFVPYTPKR
jgi:peptidoglycan/LPS O-acetylase OafA/YrhL